MHKVFVLIVINNVLAALKKFDAIHTFLFCFVFEPSDQKLLTACYGRTIDFFDKDISFFLISFQNHIKHLL